jgi:hypothetical protein
MSNIAQDDPMTSGKKKLKSLRLLGVLLIALVGMLWGLAWWGESNSAKQTTTTTLVLPPTVSLRPQPRPAVVQTPVTRVTGVTPAKAAKPKPPKKPKLATTIRSTMSAPAAQAPVLVSAREGLTVAVAGESVTVSYQRNGVSGSDTFAKVQICGKGWLQIPFGNKRKTFNITYQGNVALIGGVSTGWACTLAPSGGSSSSGARDHDTDWVKQVETRPGEQVREDATPNDSGQQGTDAGNNSPDPDKPGKPPKIGG